MVAVKFSCMDPVNDAVYVFKDSDNNRYSLYVDGSKGAVAGLNPDFYDSFYFSDSIKVEYRLIDGERVVTKILSYKKV